MRRTHAISTFSARAGLGLALLLALPAGAIAADPPGAPVSPALREALQRDLGLAPERLSRYLDLERRAPRQEAEARRALGSAFGGAWLERGADGEHRLVVASTSPTASARLSMPGAELRTVRHSLAALEAGQAQLDQRRSRAARSPALQSWHIDLPGNRIVLTVDPGATAQARAFLAESGLDPALVRIETSAQRPQPVNDIRGGDRYNTPSSWCSIGFSVTQGAQTGFVTAGHCAGVGTAVSGGNGVAIGNFAGSTFPGADYAWVRNTSGAWNIRPLVNNYAGGTLTVIGGMETGVGGAVCRSGARTGYRCGVVTAKNVTVNYSAGATYGLVRSSACVGGGDSGGSFITPGGEAQGVTSGGQLNPQTNENCSIANPVTFHQPLQPILNAYGLVLQTAQTCGRMNPGRVLGTGGSIVSCDGRFSLVIQGDGHLVLYQAGVGAIWWNNVFGAGHSLHMQTDGNLVVYNNVGQARWNTGTHGRNGAALYVQNDGNVVIYTHQGQAVWASNTGGR
jgi:streptogrisin C